MARRWRLATTTAAVAFVLTFGITSPATASEQPLGNCWVDLVTNDHLCVPAGVDIVGAVAEEKGIHLIIPGNASGPESEAFGVTGESGVLTSTVLAIMYDDANYGGSSFLMSVSGTVTCGTYTYSDLHQFGWGDRISSYRTYAGCRGTIYEDILLVGAQYGPTANAPQLYGMNDKGSSFKAAP